MLSFDDRRKVKKENFETLKKNFLLACCTVELPQSKNRIIYTDSIEKVEKNVVYILEDKKLYDGFIDRIDNIEGNSIINKIELDLKDYDSKLFYYHADSIVLKFDPFALIYSSIFKEFQFKDREIFSSVKELREKSFVEKILIDVGKTLKEFFLKRNGFYIEVERKEPLFLLTFDIDRVKYFGWKKDIYYNLKNILIKDKISTKYLDLKKIYRDRDPWDRIDQIVEILKDNRLQGNFYIFSKKRDIFTSRYDHKVSKSLHAKLEQNYNVGLHLSFESFSDEGMLKMEIEKFKSITKKEIIDVRFHFLNRLNEKHVKIFKDMNVRTDSSIGDRKKTSFLTGFSNPFFLDENILELPVISMDSALNLEEMKGEKYDKVIDEILKEVENVKGVFNFIFHPSSLDDNTYPGYSKYLFEVIRKTREKNFKTVSIEKLYGMLKSRIEILKVVDGNFFLDTLSDYTLKFYNRDNVFIEKKFKMDIKEVI
ncbi:MAG: hypothetical protein QME48_01560 [bacterium]|uniref:Uncharacterized protein n=2 Tax=Bacteria candidate phyla TaxID=1783234 RepID=A0A101I0R2_UNCT6|nr:MAG: hypothetical protein XD76_1361 [candidate division TA06 bacterium 32_111]KUK86656.1 MAG: hypothetical protein XE03_1355 [candidate division TA06 bacterium 34_109]MDI6699906.1 hypothetical protein [bacterium]HAF08389.1 hypothetical protein [candidate division WOR-3 bacterium]HCP16607.1 hypothetical protein [candidate division WOR-3 bacterium]